MVYPEGEIILNMQGLTGRTQTGSGSKALIWDTDLVMVMDITYLPKNKSLQSNSSKPSKT